MELDPDAGIDLPWRDTTEAAGIAGGGGFTGEGPEKDRQARENRR